MSDHNRPLSDRFLEALAFAHRVHGNDTRKGTAIPYVAHLLSVCGSVLVDGGGEDEAIAALLHDTLEDHADTVSRAELGQRFGERVLALVDVCTDTPADYRGGPKPPWRERKTAYLERLRRAPAGDLRVAVADKLDNARAVLADYRDLGEALWPRFNAGRDEQLWYLRSLVGGFREAGVRGRLVDELDRTVSELERLTS
jgi:(p)ppGpp synthase/HD superfamily hydrolase